MRVEALDTDVLIALLQALENPGHPEHASAKAYLEELSRGVRKVALPLPVVSEFLTGLEPQKWPEVLAYLEKHFRLLELNKAAAIEAARFFKARLDQEPLKGQERQCVRTDTFILGIAKVHGCTKVYTKDKRMAALTGQGLEVEEGLPKAIQDPLL
uniref:PIN domain-containing protein n=1 Tax=Thermus tengchongensis TaxID=1214928 RepID=A0A7V4EHF5_9DEIN